MFLIYSRCPFTLSMCETWVWVCEYCPLVVYILALFQLQTMIFFPIVLKCLSSLFSVCGGEVVNFWYCVVTKQMVP